MNQIRITSTKWFKNIKDMLTVSTILEKKRNFLKNFLPLLTAVLSFCGLMLRIKGIYICRCDKYQLKVTALDEISQWGQDNCFYLLKVMILSISKNNLAPLLNFRKVSYKGSLTLPGIGELPNLQKITTMRKNVQRLTSAPKDDIQTV